MSALPSDAPALEGREPDGVSPLFGQIVEAVRNGRCILLLGALSPDRRWLSMGGPNKTTLLVRCRGCAPLDQLKADARRDARGLTATERRQYLPEGEPVRDPY